MKCTHCGTELSENDKLCGTCGKPVETEITEPTAIVAAETEPVSMSAQDAPTAGKKKGTMTAIIIAAIAVIAIAVFAAANMTAKDPKEVVIAAFENIWPDGQVSPTEELFGTSELVKAMSNTDSETSLSLKLDSCSNITANNFAGAGLRIAGKNDITNNKSSFLMGVSYNDMEAANLDFYYGDNTLMISLPELISKVFTLDLSDGLADRMKNAPTVGAYLAQNGVDVDAMAAYLQEMMDEAVSQSERETTPFDIGALRTRYREGCKAQDNFKAALVVVKNGSGTFTLDGKEVSCTGYQVTVSKDSMIEFLRTSSDFFLQDETLKKDFLKQLEISVRMSEIMGAGAYGGTLQTPEEAQQENYEELKNNVDEMITHLDNSLSDMELMVYVDKSGRLASVDGKTSVKEYIEDGTGAEGGSVDVAFQWNLQGGSYLTQNMNGSITLLNPEDAEDQVTITFNRQGTYDKTNLTDDISVDFDEGSSDQIGNFMFTSSYSVADGSFHTAAEVGTSEAPTLRISCAGVIDGLEKGKSIHITIDELKTSVRSDYNFTLNNLETSTTDGYNSVILSGEYSMSPLQSEIVAPEGEQMDILTATEEEWQDVFMEGLFSAYGMMQELGIQ